jgi:hypothetical protein
MGTAPRTLKGKASKERGWREVDLGAMGGGRDDGEDNSLSLCTGDGRAQERERRDAVRGIFRNEQTTLGRILLRIG